MERWVGRVALVTGASSGIGSAVAEDLVRAGMKVVGIGTRVEKIEEIAADLRSEKGSLIAIKCDLSNEQEISDLFSTIKKKYGGVDVCVNNAGISGFKSLMEGTGAEWRQMLEVNVVSLCLCSQLSIQSMRERGVDDGHVINISSISGHRQALLPFLHFYSATKHAVRALVEGFRMEMREAKSHIRISSVSPGFVETDFIRRMTNDPAKAAGFYSISKCLEVKDISNTVLHILASPPHVEINDVIMRPTEQPNSNHVVNAFS